MTTTATAAIEVAEVVEPEARPCGGGCLVAGLGKRAGRVPSFAVGRAVLRAREVAAILFISRDSVFEMCRLGNFPGAYLEGDEWRIPLADLDAYQEQRRAVTRKFLEGVKGGDGT